MIFSRFLFPSKPQIRSLARTLRASDRRELDASHGKQPSAQLLQAFVEQSCEMCVMSVDGETAAMGGIAADAHLPNAACVWMLTGTAVEKYPKSFFKICRTCLADFLQRYDVLYNWVDARYAQAVRFILRLGGELNGTYRICNGHKFLFFIFRRK